MGRVPPGRGMLRSPLRFALSRIELLSALQAGEDDLAASDHAGGPFPAPLRSLDLRGAAEWTLSELSLGDCGRCRLRGLRRWCRRCRSRQPLPARGAEGTWWVHRCSTIWTESNRRTIHDALLGASPSTRPGNRSPLYRTKKPLKPLALKIRNQAAFLRRV